MGKDYKRDDYYLIVCDLRLAAEKVDLNICIKVETVQHIISTF